jgi:hypothetical protein
VRVLLSVSHGVLMDRESTKLVKREKKNAFSHLMAYPGTSRRAVALVGTCGRA